MALDVETDAKVKLELFEKVRAYLKTNYSVKNFARQAYSLNTLSPKVIPWDAWKKDSIKGTMQNYGIPESEYNLKRFDDYMEGCMKSETKKAEEYLVADAAKTLPGMLVDALLGNGKKSSDWLKEVFE
jgi:hypothetical protein